MSENVCTRNRGRKEVVNPIFLECSSLCKDEFWISIYNDLSLGKTPRGLYLKNGALHSTNKRKGFSYTFTKKTAEEIMTELHVLITEKTNIYSDKDMKKKKKDMEKVKNKIKQMRDVDKFSMIRKKKTREMLLDAFVIKMKYKYKLQWDIVRSLREKIKLGFLEKKLVSADVIYKEGEIKKIRGLIYDEETQQFELNNKSKLKTEVIVKDDILLSRYWNKKTKKSAGDE